MILIVTTLCGTENAKPCTITLYHHLVPLPCTVTNSSNSNGIVALKTQLMVPRHLKMLIEIAQA